MTFYLQSSWRDVPFRLFLENFTMTTNDSPATNSNDTSAASGGSQDAQKPSLMKEVAGDVAKSAGQTAKSAIQSNINREVRQGVSRAISGIIKGIFKK